VNDDFIEDEKIDKYISDMKSQFNNLMCFKDLSYMNDDNLQKHTYDTMDIPGEWKRWDNSLYFFKYFIYVRDDIKN
jgi:hypothetical protein